MHNHPHSHSHSAPIGRGEKAGLMRRAIWAALAVASTLVVIKIMGWWVTGSISMLTSLLDSLMDVLASTMNFFAVRWSLKPADDDHRFGHGKAEDIAALAQTFFIAGTAVFLFGEAVHRLFEPMPLTDGPFGIAIMVVSLIATSGLVLFQRHVVRSTDSTAIRGDFAHYYMDLLSNAGVIVALLLGTHLGWEQADPIIAIIIAVYICHHIIELGRRALNHLMDKEFEETERQEIIAVANRHSEVLAIHDLRTRRSGLDSFIQFNLDFPALMPLVESHRITEEIEEEVKKIFPAAEIFIHQEPK